MQAELIRIGNSQGIRIPKVILEECGFIKSVEIVVEGNCLIIKPVNSIRSGWDKAFKIMAEMDDEMPFDETSNAFDEKGMDMVKGQKPARFDVFLVSLDPTIGSEIQKTRPCVIISPDEMNRHLKTVIIAPMTSTLKNYPSQIFR